MRKALLIALLMVGMTRLNPAQQVRTVHIPGDAWTAYSIPAGGSALQLYINRADSRLAIDDSEILLEDSSDTVQWYRSSANPATHVYQIGTVFSACEYLHVFGHYHHLDTGSGAASVASLTFNARVAAPDVDMENLTEEEEETLGAWLAKEGTRRAVTIHPVQCRMSGTQQILSWSSAKLSLWTAATGGSILPGNSKSLSADQGYTYYVQGQVASASMRDSQVAVSYTVDGKTAQDKVKLTVVDAEIAAFDTLLLNATNAVSITLSPTPAGTHITLQISCLGGTGAAVFVPSDDTSSNITQSTTVNIKGVTVSSVASNMLLRAMLGSDVLASNLFTVVGTDEPLQYKIGTNSWANMSDPLYVCKDTTVKFRAIKSPTNASWPSGKPVWGGVLSGSGMESNSYTFVTLSTQGTDYKIVSAECGNTVTGRVLVASLTLSNVTFSGNNFYAMKQDNGANYPSVHWSLTNNAPVLFKRNTKMKAAAILTANLSGFSGDVVIRGNGPGNLNIPETTVTASGGIATLPATECSNAFTNSVGFLDKMEMSWEYATQGNSIFNHAGASSNQVYISLGEPSGVPHLYHTVVHLACSVGNATNEDEAVSNSWSQLTGKTFTTWDGRKLYYYRAGAGWNSPGYINQLLATSNGNCIAWRNLFRHALKINDVNSDYIFVQATGPIAEYFLIGDWTFGTACFTNTPPYNWKLQFTTNSVDMVPRPSGDVYGDLISLTTIEGQGFTAPPSEKVFGNHRMARYNGVYYDPSYGVKHVSITSFVNTAVDGYAYYQSGDPATNLVLRTKLASEVYEIGEWVNNVIDFTDGLP